MTKTFMTIFIVFLLTIGTIRTVFAELADPTRPTLPSELNNENIPNGPSSDVKDNLQLNAIIYSPTKPVVIINGTVLGINDVINGYRVKEIDRQSVELSTFTGNGLSLKFDTLDVKRFHTAKPGNSA